jgi:hypothetical protein
VDIFTCIIELLIIGCYNLWSIGQPENLKVSNAAGLPFANQQTLFYQFIQKKKGTPKDQDKNFFVKSEKRQRFSRLNPINLYLNSDHLVFPVRCPARDKITRHSLLTALSREKIFLRDALQKKCLGTSG